MNEWQRETPRYKQAEQLAHAELMNVIESIAALHDSLQHLQVAT